MDVKRQHGTILLSEEEKIARGRRGFESLLDSLGDITVPAQPKLQHCKYHYMGYRDTILGREDCPFEPGNPAADSWLLGHILAKADKAKMIQE